MPEIWKPLVSNSASVAPEVVFSRLVAALVLGAVVAWIYRQVRREEASSSLAVTLVLLCILISMVSQVVGDNVARAFSLVGALSIVRFRTVVKDTQDTAYVIFAVVVGMAAGTSDLWVALIGIGVVTVASFAMAKLFRAGEPGPPEYLLRFRVPPGQDLASVFTQSVAPHLASHDLVSLGTLKGGLSLEVIYRVRLRGDLVTAASAIGSAAGVEDLQLRRANGDDN
ncbi:MAG: DUF4956 domain-containing protein [Bryobacteraceae bacterium]|nr:DUF4956 domain-containing protein [Bryobacteraceae bacterium]